MTAGEDQEVVEAVLSDGPHPALGVRVRPRGSERRADGLGADRAEDRVKGGYVLRVAISHEEPEAPAAVVEGRCEVASALGHPYAGRVGRDTEDVHDAPLHLDHEEHVVAAEDDAVDGEEVRGHDPLRLGAKEL